MPQGLERFQDTKQSHFVTFSCYHRRPYFATAELFEHFVETLEDMRRHFELCIYGYVVMPEHVHLLLSEPPAARLADAIHYLKLLFAKRVRSLRGAPGSRPLWDANLSGSFWQSVTTTATSGTRESSS
jgi:putative transposase